MVHLKKSLIFTSDITVIALNILFQVAKKIKKAYAKMGKHISANFKDKIVIIIDYVITTMQTKLDAIDYVTKKLMHS